MNPEYLLDAMGLLDDDLIQEAEQYQRRNPQINYSRWLAWAASFALVIALGYGVTHLRMDSGNSTAGGSEANGGAASAPVGSCGGMDELYPDGSTPQNGGDWAEPGSPNGSCSSDTVVPQEPEANGEGSLTGDWLPAIRVDGVIYYWDTREYIHLEPEEDDIRYTTSFINSWEPEEDGQANFLPVGLPYVVLDNGTVAVLHNEETNSWEVYDSVPPWEK